MNIFSIIGGGSAARMLGRLGCVFAAGVAFFGPASAQDLHSHAAIRAAVTGAVRAELTQNGARVTVEADEIDARLRLAHCDSPLAVKIPPARRGNTRVTAEVRCAGSNPWKVHVPARVVVYQQVVVAARSMARGSVLAAGDIELAEQDTSSLPAGFLLQTEHAIGTQLRRDINAGKPLSPAMLETPALVKRGQQVTLEAGSGGMVVRMAGVAKADGIKGQVIPVENTRSRRVVHGVVRTGRTVEVPLQ
ncbi:MAG: flagellar basal body P-ring formation chaperone FlgA [Gammaproteobacteria bacterium]